jgi:TolB-like protein/Tfp pilus assembly protein PilF
MSLFTELKRRNVIRMAGLYLVGAWLVVQVAATLLPVFAAPGWVMRVLVGLLAAGFIAALVFSWVFELTPGGLKRDAEIPDHESIAPQTARRMDRMIIVVLLAALGYFAVDKFVLAPARDASAEMLATTTSATKAAADAPAEAAIGDRSIAVLPFVDMSEAQDQEYFSDGLSEEILNLLVQIRDLKVIGRTSSFAFKGKNEDLRTIGDTLGVAYLLEGSVRKAGDELRITAQLIEVEDGTHVWSQRYDRKLENVFDIQSEIAASIAQALRINLFEAGRSAPEAQVAASLPAYELFLQARRLIHGRTRGGIAAARGLLEDALTLDPNYAPALAALAQTLLLLNSDISAYGDIPMDQALAMAQPLLDRALALDPKLAEAHAVQGFAFNYQRDFARAAVALSTALSLNPNLPDALHWQAMQLENSGRLRESLALRQRLDAIDPLNVANMLRLNGRLRDGGKLAEAQAVTARLLRAFPDSPQTFSAQAFDLLETGRLAEAQIPAARMLALGSNWAQATNAFVYYLLGDFDRALALQSTPELRARALSALGRSDEDITELRARLDAAPDDLDAARALLAALTWSGRLDEALAQYREHMGGIKGLEAVAPTDSGPFEAIAAAQRATGDEDGLAETLALWRKRLDVSREQGYASGGFVMTQARHFALADERAAALKALTQAIDLGVRDPLLDRDPAFAELRDDPAFKAQLTRMTALINIERAKLGMAPLP